MSKIKKLYLPLLVSVAMNIGNVYASDDTDTRKVSSASSSSSSSPAPTSTSFPIQDGEFILKISDDYTVAVPGRTSANSEVSAILDSTFNELGASVPKELSKLMGAYEYTPSLFCYLYKSSKIVTALNSETGKKVVDIQLDTEPYFAIHFGTSLYVFESLGGISVISTITNPPIKYYFQSTWSFANPRSFTLMGDKISVNYDNGSGYLISLGDMEKDLEPFLARVGFEANIYLTTRARSSASSASSTFTKNNTNNNNNTNG